MTSSGDSPDFALLWGFIGRNGAESLSLVASLLARRADKLSAPFLPSKGKERLVRELVDFFNDLNLSKVRVSRPSKFLFLCGGTISPDNSADSKSLRDYLHRVKSISRKVRADIVLAEWANQIYRDTSYRDLISFEEDIARIASVVLVIAESPGSLAELGAFATNDTIRQSLRIIIQQKYEKAESFIRYGPVERIIKDGDQLVGFFPWRTQSGSGSFVQSSVAPHRSEILNFINGHVDKAPASQGYPSDPKISIFYIVYWAIYLSVAISRLNLVSCVASLVPGVSDNEVREKVYCMQIAGWIDSYRYSNKEYFFALKDKDPFSYGFKAGVANRDSARRKAIVANLTES